MYRVALSIFAALLCAGNITAAEVLTSEQWREDLNQLSQSVLEHHPDPFDSISEADFEQSITQLRIDLDSLTDKEIIVRMVAITAALRDGHTRLAIPEQYPEQGTELGHTGTADPKDKRLQFSRLPVAFGLFDDGLFVIAATDAQQSLLGTKVERIGSMSADAAVDAVGSVAFGDNKWTRRLLIPGLLGMPEVLDALNITDTSEAAELSIHNSDGQVVSVLLHAGDTMGQSWISAEKNRPLWRSRPNDKYWSHYFDDGQSMYIQINEINNEKDSTLASFMTATMTTAAANQARRLVIDLRNNSGGSGSFNRSVILAVLRDNQVNQYGHLYALIGRRTFSAAQFLVMDLERYARVIFVGEPTGGSPTSFGDPKKIILSNSGLTLRVSTIHWHSYLAAEFRDAIPPHLRVSYSSTDYFGGLDPVLNEAMTHAAPESIVELCASLLRKGNVNSAAIILLKHMTDPQTAGDSIESELAELGEQFVLDGDTRNARYVFMMGAEFFPRSERFRAEMQELQQD